MLHYRMAYTMAHHMFVLANLLVLTGAMLGKRGLRLEWAGGELRECNGDGVRGNKSASVAPTFPHLQLEQPQ